VSAGTAPGRWLRRFHPSDHAPARLVYFPHAGGAASSFHPFSARLEPALDVLAVQYPGRQDRFAEPFARDVDELADRVSEELLPWCDRPLGLFGHSLGAGVAYEVAVRLQRRHRAPALLVASGRRAPSCHRECEPLHLAPDDRLLAAMVELGGTAPEVLAHEQLVRAMLPVLRADLRAAETYGPRSGNMLECPVSVLVGTDDAEVTDAEATAWGAHTTASCTVRRYSGGHFFLDLHADDVCRHLVSLLGA